MVISGDLSRTTCLTHCNILCKKVKPARRPRSTVSESTMTDRIDSAFTGIGERLTGVMITRIIG